MSDVWIAILAAPVAIAVIVYAILAEKRRKKRLNAWAQANGFVPYDATPELDWLRDFDAWGHGISHRARDGHQGAMGDHPVRVFTLRSKTDNNSRHGSSSTGNQQARSTEQWSTVAVFETKISAPRLRIKRENLGHKLIDALGAEDIDFESDEFSRKFWVKCKDRKFAYDVLHPRAMEFMLQTSKMHWEWQGHLLVLHVPDKLDPARVDPLLEAGQKLLDLLPGHLEAS